MARSYSLSIPTRDNGTRTIEIDQNKDGVEVGIDGVRRHTFASTQELARGWKSELADGSKLEVRLVHAYGRFRLHVAHDGVAVPGSEADPRRTMRGGGVWLVLFGGMWMFSTVRMDEPSWKIYAGAALIALGIGTGLGRARISTVTLGIALVVLFCLGVAGLRDKEWIEALASFFVLMSLRYHVLAARDLGRRAPISRG